MKSIIIQLFQKYSKFIHKSANHLSGSRMSRIGNGFEPSIFSALDTALEGIKEGSRGKFTSYFKNLREEKKMKSSTCWIYYSMLNSVVKGIYGQKLQAFPRITTLLKAYDVDIKSKAAVFETDHIASFVNNPETTYPYWLVRKVKITYLSLNCKVLSRGNLPKLWHGYDSPQIIRVCFCVFP